MTEFTIEKLVDELVEVKTELKILQNRERQLKKKIEPLIPHGDSFCVQTAEVYCAEHKSRRIFHLDQVLQFLRNEYGEEVAGEVDNLCYQHMPGSRNVRVRLKPDNATPSNGNASM